MTDLFDRAGERDQGGTPFPDLARPERLEDVVGQAHLLGPEGILSRAIVEDRLFSMILWGPPGTGKTTIANVIARTTGSIFVPFSAVLGGVKEVRAIVEEAREEKKYRGRKTILFVDEIHRFNKAQQDAFLPHVEKGTVVLIGATTENPSFAINSPLLSRCRVLVLESLAEDDLVRILERGIGLLWQRTGTRLAVEGRHLASIARAAAGDARRALHLLEILGASVGSRPRDGGAGEESVDPGGDRAGIVVTDADMEGILGEKALRYDRSGEEHYNVISAFIKSLRGSDPDAVLYYMARMLEAGEDPLFVLRRMMIFAAEDVGVADPQALVLATSAMVAFEHLGMPEGYLPMAEAAIYLATAPKSNSAIASYQRAKRAAVDHGALPVPMHLRNAVTALMKAQGYGEGYRYPHDLPGHWVAEEYLPEAIRGERFYVPSDIGHEKVIRERLAKMAAFKARAGGGGTGDGEDPGAAGGEKG